MQFQFTKKVALIVPYESLIDIAKNYIKTKELSVDMEVFCLDEKEAIEVVKEKGFEIVIAKGSTAEGLRNLPNINVIEIGLGTDVLLQDFQELYEKGFKKIHVISYERFFPLVFDNLKYKGLELVFKRINNINEMHFLIGDSKLNDCDVILTNRFGYKIATHLGIKAKIATVKIDALYQAIDLAYALAHLEKVKRLQLNRLDLVINNVSEGVIILNRKKEVVFHNVTADSIMHGIHDRDWFDTLEPYFADTKDKNKILNINNKQVMMQCKHFEFEGTDIKNYIVFLQDTKDIEKREHRVRRYNIAKGHVAKATFDSIIVKDVAMQKLVSDAKKFAKTSSTILICGATGVGKELIAQSIHNASSRKNQPFVSVNCASLPPSLIESELFGYAEGAFTGARQKGKMGLFELAHGGTIFLDEIGELPIDIQSRLLRVLQEREIMRIGDDKVIPLDVRIICAINRHLWELSQEGKFRLDLYYRINVLRLRIPSLKDRPDDILPIFNMYLNKFLNSKNKAVIEEDAKNYLLSWPWPGNIRELRNVAEAVVLFGSKVTLKALKDIMWMGNEFTSENGYITSTQDHNKTTIKVLKQEHLAPKNQENIAKNLQGNTSDNISLNINELASIKDLERMYINKLLKKYSADEVCKILNISRVTLWRKIKKDNATNLK